MKKLQKDLNEYWEDKKAEDLKDIARNEAKVVLKTAKNTANELLVVHKDDMVQAIKCAVETQINGNLREIKKHLFEQDEKLNDVVSQITILDKKIKPVSITTAYLKLTGKIIVYVGILAGSIFAIIKLIKI
jgi:acetoin utilization deacetylase AcuC-like enzyme